MNPWYYAEPTNWLTIGVDLSQWGLPLYVSVTAESLYRSVEVRVLFFYFSANWCPSVNGTGDA